MYNQYYQPYMQQQPYMMQPQLQNQIQPQNSVLNNRTNTLLPGKVVDSIDVVKAIEIPLDGSISFFPLADNSAIITKQLQPDGTSKISVFIPSNENEEKKEEIKYVTVDELNKAISEIDFDDVKNIKEDLKKLKRNFEDLTDSLSDKKKGK